MPRPMQPIKELKTVGYWVFDRVRAGVDRPLGQTDRQRDRDREIGRGC